MESPESLLEHATWLRRLAASLVRDQALADDLTQDTWTAALGNPPKPDYLVRPWLARVMRNAARFRWRSETNRTAREAASVASSETVTPTSEELLARHQLQRLLAGLVGELDEPFRGTILLRYAEGLEPTEIAKRLGIPASTVRWRVKEALERLRCGLDAAHQGDRKTWLRALAPIALWSHPSRAAAGTTAVVVGGAVVLASLAIVVGLTHRDSNASSTRLASIARALPIVEVNGPAPPAPSWFVQPGAPPRHLTGRVVRDGKPVANALVRLVSDDAPAIERQTDAQGRFDLGGQSARTVTLGAAAGDALAAIRHLDLRDPTSSTDVELELTTCSAWIAGRVIDPVGSPIPQARVLREDAIGTETDSTGSYELCALPTAALGAQLDIVVRADGYGAIAAGVAPAGRSHRDFVLTPEATITGTTVPNASIWAEADRDVITRTGERPARQVTRADPGGRFRIAGASGGRYRVSGAAPGMLATITLVAVAPTGTTDVTVQMVPAATVHGRLVTHGAPVSGAHIAIRTETVVARHDDPAMDRIAVSTAVTQADGSFVLDSLPPGKTWFTAHPLGVVTKALELAPGDNTIALEGVPMASIRGFVRRHGVAVPFARVDINGGYTSVGLTADATGHYEANGLEPIAYEFYADDGKRGADAGGTFGKPLAWAETRDFDIELLADARISGTVVDVDGRPVPDVSVRFRGSDGEEGRCTTDSAGAYSCGSLGGGGTYTPSVMPGDNATRPFPFARPTAGIALAPDAEVDGVVLSVDPRTTSIDGVVLDDGGTPAIDVRVRARGRGIDHNGWVTVPTTVTDSDGHFRFEQLPPGDYDLEAESLTDSRSARGVATGGTTRLTLRLVHPVCAATVPVQPAYTPASPIVWDDRIELLGWDMPSSAHVGEDVDVTLVFRARAPISYPWRLFAHFDSTVHRKNADHTAAGDDCATSTWKPGDIYVDHFTTQLSYAETFALMIGFFRPSDNDGPWQNLAGPGDPVTGLKLGTITVTPNE